MPPETITEPPSQIYSSDVSVGEAFPMTSVDQRQPPGRKQSETNSSVKGPVSTASMEIFLRPVSSTTQYNADNVPNSKADRHTDGVPEYQPRSIDFARFRG